MCVCVYSLIYIYTNTQRYREWLSETNAVAQCGVCMYVCIYICVHDTAKEIVCYTAASCAKAPGANAPVFDAEAGKWEVASA